MSDPMFVLLTATLKFGLVTFICIRELILVRRLRNGDERDPRHDPAPAPLLPDAGAGPERKLPECLIPRPAARPVDQPRQLEPV